MLKNLMAYTAIDPLIRAAAVNAVVETGPKGRAVGSRWPFPGIGPRSLSHRAGAGAVVALHKTEGPNSGADQAGAFCAHKSTLDRTCAINSHCAQSFQLNSGEQEHSPSRAISAGLLEDGNMDGLIYLIGLIVVIMAILSFFGLR